MSMIASVLHLDRSAVKGLRVTDLYSLHRVVYSLYEDLRDEAQKQTSKPSGILFADQGGDSQGRRILLLANRNPASSVDREFGYVQSKPVPASFLEHDRYGFKVIVNPTSRSSSTGKLVPARGRGEITRWFTSRAQDGWGFKPSSHVQVNKVEVLRFVGKHKDTITLCQAHLHGQLEVLDRSRFQNSFRTGIGRGRAFGCGLLQLVPLADTHLPKKEFTNE